MIKNRTIIECEVKGREFRLECASDNTWADVQTALGILMNIANANIPAEAPPKEEETA